MTDYYYPTAQNVLVFANGVLIDQAYRLDWKETAPVVPLYGYNDYEPSFLMRGRKIVQGFLVVNFIYPGYLSTLLETVSKKTFSSVVGFPFIDNDPAKLEKFVTDGMPPALPETREARAEFIANLFDKNNFGRSAEISSPEFNIQALDTAHRFRKTITTPSSSLIKEKITIVDKQEIKRLLLKQFTETNSIKKTIQVNTPLSYHGSIDLEIYYKDPAESLWYIQIEGIKFSDISQTITIAGAEGSAEPLYEINEFIALRRKIINLK